MKNDFGKNAAIWALIFVGAMLLLSIMGQGGANNRAQEVTYSQFLTLVENGQFTQVQVQGNTLSGVNNDGETTAKIKTRAPNDPDLIATLRQKGVDIKVIAPESNTALTYILSYLPWIIFIGIWIYFMRQMQGGGKGGGGANPFSFGKSRAKMLTEDQVKVKFTDVAGVDEAKEELAEVVDFLKSPEKYQRLGGKIPKGVLLVGPPGTGKTLLAKAVAGEAEVPFFSLSGSDFVEMFVGVGAARVRDLFEQGKKNSPCIIFIDEIDAVGRHRGAGIGGGNDEREQTLNAMLVEMDGFSATEGVILIAATNRPDVLDPALLRPGRFDRQVTVPLPDIKGREYILQVHMEKVPLGADVKADIIARGTPGFSGADLANLVNEAALMAARGNKRLVDMHDFEQAKDKVMMGAERKSTVMSAAEKENTAYHEAGHAICTMYIDGPKDPLHKVTIIPRGRALGVTMSLPTEDKYNYYDDQARNEIAIFMGGRIAEEMMFKGRQSAGASNDIERATQIARRMVCNWGMSPLGTIDYSDRKELSDNMAEAVDREVAKIIDTNYKRCEAVLKKHKDKLITLTKSLLEHETLDIQQIEDLFAGKKIRPPSTAKVERKKISQNPTKSHKDTPKKEKTAQKTNKTAPKSPKKPQKPRKKDS